MPSWNRRLEGGHNRLRQGVQRQRIGDCGSDTSVLGMGEAGFEGVGEDIRVAYGRRKPVMHDRCIKVTEVSKEAD